MKQIKDKDLVKGKTIKKMHTADDELFISFTDDTFAIFVIKEETEGFGFTRSSITVSEDDADFCNSGLIEIGVISDEEHRKAWEEFDRRMDEERAEYDKKVKDEHEMREVLEYQRLKKKYE